VIYDWGSHFLPSLFEWVQGYCFIFHHFLPILLDHQRLVLNFSWACMFSRYWFFPSFCCSFAFLYFLSSFIRLGCCIDCWRVFVFDRLRFHVFPFQIDWCCMFSRCCSCCLMGLFYWLRFWFVVGCFWFLIFGFYLLLCVFGLRCCFVYVVWVYGLFIGLFGCLHVLFDATGFLLWSFFMHACGLWWVGLVLHVFFHYDTWNLLDFWFDVSRIHDEDFLVLMFSIIYDFVRSILKVWFFCEVGWMLVKLWFFWLIVITMLISWEICYQ